MSSAKKIIIIGHFGVGKSSLIKRFVENSFSDNYTVTIGVHISKKVIQINNKELTLVIWDLEGKDNLNKILPAYLIGTSGFIYVIDSTRENTYVNFNEEVRNLKNKFPNTKIITVANKSDLIDIKLFKSHLKKLDIEIDYTASAKTGETVSEIFHELGKYICDD